MAAAPEDRPSFPIFIPSRGRHGAPRGTALLLAASRLPFHVVVEPHEVANYRRFLDDVATAARVAPADVASLLHLEVLPESHQGISYVRNYILRKLAPARGWFWVMDDDIRGFSRATAQHVNASITAAELHAEVERRMLRFPNAALFSLDYPFYAYQYGDEAVAVNSYNNIAVLTNRERLPPDVEYRFRIREDYDLTLQLIRSGCTTVRFRNLSYAVPRMSVNVGGMTDYYAKHKDDIRRQNQLFVAAWPSVAREVVKGTGPLERFDINIKWIALAPNRCADPAAVLRSTVPLNTGPLRAPTARTGKGGGGASADAKKRTRRVATTSSSSSSDTTDDGNEGDAAVDDGSDSDLPLSAAVPQRAPRRQADLLVPKAPPGWKGYAMVEWRDVTPEAALAAAGLQRIADADVTRGLTVAIVPPSLAVASCLVTAIVIEQSRKVPFAEWTVVVQRMRGVPLQSVRDCYCVPADLGAACAALQAAIEGAGEPTTP